MKTESTTPELSIEGFLPGHFVQRQIHGASFSAEILSSPGSELRVGLTDAGARASLSASTSLTKGADSGRTNLHVCGLAPGGPYILHIQAGSASVQREFFVGDLWLMGGQSNMEGQGLMADAAKPHPLIRNFTMARIWEEAREPLHFLPESPDWIHHRGYPQNQFDARISKMKAVRGSGLGLHFAQKMLAEAGVPQGLISCAHGGTSMAEWSPRVGDDPARSLYASMLRSLRMINQPLAGVLWYQGESDTADGLVPLYRDRMVELVQSLRDDTRQQGLPWLTVQIGREVGRRWSTEAWHRIQDAQRLLPRSIKNLDVLASADLEHDDWIHISGRSLAVLATRMAALARNFVVGEPKALPGPQVLRAVWVDDEISPLIRVDFTGVEGALVALGRPQGFTLADSKLKEHSLIYQARIEGSSVLLRLTSDDIFGLGVCHGIDCEAVINTYDSRGLAIPVFGPLEIEGIPARSPWFRTWRISPALSGSGESTRQPNHYAGADLNHSLWPSRLIEGWNVVNMQALWSQGKEIRAFRTWVRVPSSMRCRLELIGDGPLAVWWNDTLVVDDPRPIRDLGEKRYSPVLDLAPGCNCLTVLMENRSGLAYGFAARMELHGQKVLGPGMNLPLEADEPH